MPFVQEHKFLGLMFDKKINWRPHIQDIVKRCKIKLNILKKITGISWGNDSKSMLIVYKALIRSLFDYGCEAYDSASNLVKNTLNSVQYQALKIITGGPIGTSLQSLLKETGEEPLDIRRKMLTNRYYFKVKSTPEHPVQKCTINCWQYENL